MHSYKILVNKAKCLKCEDIIQSTYRHDFKTCKCGAIFIDGGTDYLRMGGDSSFMEDMCVIVEEE